MQGIFDFASLEQQPLECEECGWRGQGFETEKGFEALPVAIEVYCPVCGNFLGEVPRDGESLQYA